MEECVSVGEDEDGGGVDMELELLLEELLLEEGVEVI